MLFNAGTTTHHDKAAPRLHGLNLIKWTQPEKIRQELLVNLLIAVKAPISFRKAVNHHHAPEWPTRGKVRLCPSWRATECG
jgi:hypothetical protein